MLQAFDSTGVPTHAHPTPHRSAAYIKLVAEPESTCDFCLIYSLNDNRFDVGFPR
jgi:hypothetical protein